MCGGGLRFLYCQQQGLPVCASCWLGGHTSGCVFGSVPVVCAWLGGSMLSYLLQCVCLDMDGWFGSECLVEYVLCGPVSDV